MTVPFGFSVGDCIAGLKLVKDLIEALDDTFGARPAYRRLIAQLHSLDKALTAVQCIDIPPPQKYALEQVAIQCHKSIEQFLTDNVKFQASLGLQSPPSGSRWRLSVHKLQWALCKNATIDALRAEVAGHTATINLILNTVQTATQKLQADDGKETQALVKKNHELLSTQAGLVVSISQTATAIAACQRGSDVQSVMQNVLETNLKIYAMALEMQKLMQTQLPPQVDRQQPVYFDDAHGRISPFHVEFINSFEAFHAVLEARFQHVPGLEKVKNFEYAIQDSRSLVNLDLRNSLKPWDTIFLPGRKYNMSMVFKSVVSRQKPFCPVCFGENEVIRVGGGLEVQFQWYVRIIALKFGG